MFPLEAFLIQNSRHKGEKRNKIQFNELLYFNEEFALFLRKLLRNSMAAILAHNSSAIFNFTRIESLLCVWIRKEYSCVLYSL